MYIIKDSFLHKAHPVSKLVGLINIFLYSLITREIKFLSYSLAFIIFIGIIAGCWKNFKKAILFGFIILIFSMLMWIFFYPYETVIKDKIKYGLMMGLRLNNIFLVGILFLSTTRIEEFIYGLRRFKIPYRMCFSISLAFRLIPLIYETASIVISSQRIKGVNLKEGFLIERIRKFGPTLSAIISYILRQANYLTIAVESRAFSLKGEKTEFLSFFFGIKDYLIILLSLSLLILILMQE